MKGYTDFTGAAEIVAAAVAELMGGWGGRQAVSGAPAPIKTKFILL